MEKGQRVKVIASAHAPKEHGATGRVGTFIETTGNGFARVALDPKSEWKDQSADKWLIHPENLEAIDFAGRDETHLKTCTGAMCGECHDNSSEVMY